LASEWVAAGVDAEMACDCAAEDVSPAEALEWFRVVGDDVGALLTWRAWNVTPMDAERVIRNTSCWEAPDIEWMHAGFDPGAAFLWSRAGCDPTSALTWIDAGVSDPQAACQWIAEELSSEDYVRWREVGIEKPRDAKRWTAVGATPAIAQRWMKHGFDVRDAAGWIKAGVELTAAIRRSDAGLRPPAPS
jgi:hypothetical protein